MSMSDAKNDANILVVEDDPEINELLGAYVQIAGYDYRRALNGATALEQARKHPPALIVLDLMLPDTDGFEVCRQLKSERRTAKVPIVMLTALNQDENRKKGMACGACAYMTKPFDPEKLMATIQENARVNGN